MIINVKYQFRILNAVYNIETDIIEKLESRGELQWS
jgi:hypothetical protein